MLYIILNILKNKEERTTITAQIAIELKYIQMLYGNLYLLQILYKYVKN